jgi:hypothetical protein
MRPAEISALEEDGGNDKTDSRGRQACGRHSLPLEADDEFTEDLVSALAVIIPQAKVVCSRPSSQLISHRDEGPALAFQVSLSVCKVVLALGSSVRRLLQRLDSGSLARKHFWLATGDFGELDAGGLRI